jgi:cysteine synthase
VEVEAPKVLDALKPLVSGAATAVMGPAAGAAVDWIWQAVAGVGAAGTTAGVGVVMRERTRRRQLIQAQDAYASDIEQADTAAEVAEIKRKHAERQKALGIHEQLTRERHGA